MTAVKHSLLFLFGLSSSLSISQTCDSMGVENGWGAWVAKTGVNTGGPITWSAPLVPASPRFEITSGAGIDVCTPGPAIGSPVIPVVAPGFGYASIKIESGGSAICGNACAEQLTYSFTVTPQDTSFAFSYAIVLEDPNHGITDQPYVSFCIYDSNGNAVPGGCFKYISGPSLPGFYTSACNINSVSYYKPWTLSTINLTPYIGQILSLEIINADCTLSGHFARSYWDFWCGNGILGAASLNKPVFEIFPSVSSSGIFSLRSVSGIIDLSVFNITGEKVYSKITAPHQTSMEVDLSNQPSGIYFLKLRTEQGIATKKIIIAR